MLLLLSLLACQTPDLPADVVPPPKGPLIFDPIPDPGGATRMVAHVRGPGNAQVDWHPIIATGAEIDGQIFGQIPAKGDVPAELCDSPDGQTLLEVDGHPTLISHHECSPGLITLTSLDARLDPTSIRTLPLTNGAPGFQHCAASLSPWGTHLGSEEYEPDAALVGPDGKMATQIRLPGGQIRKVSDHGFNHLVDRQGAINPYEIGWTVEVDPAAAVSRIRPALGRFSHEIALAVDDRTVYLSDDAGGGGLFLFVADQPRDLSAGALYALRWRWPAAFGWVSLGHADEGTLLPALEAGVSFSTLMDRVLPDPTGACPAGLRLTRSHTGLECLGIKPGMELLASRLETRRYAAWKSATTELSKEEGLAWDPDRNMLYVAITRVSGSMLHETALVNNLDGSHDDVQAEENPCGAVLFVAARSGVLDTDGQPIQSELVANLLQGSLDGRPDGAGGCAEDGIANPDNLTFIPGQDTLLIAEDTELHANAALWAWRTTRADPPVKILLAPKGAEVTGLSWAPGVAGADWITVAIQHPDEGAPEVGVIGPFSP